MKKKTIREILREFRKLIFESEQDEINCYNHAETEIKALMDEGEIEKVIEENFEFEGGEGEITGINSKYLAQALKKWWEEK